MTAWRGAWAAAVVAVLWPAAGCTLIPSVAVPADHYYRLPATAPGKVYPQPPLAASVAVASMRGMGLFQERPILYVETGAPLEVHQYNYRFWIEPPTKLLQTQLIAVLRTAHATPEALRDHVGTHAAAVVTGTIERYERVVGSGTDQVVVQLTLDYGDADQFKPRLLTKRYKQTVPVTGHHMNAVIVAFGTALDRIGARFIADAAAAAAGARSISAR